MTRIVTKEGEEVFCSPGEAQRRVAAGEATFQQSVPTYSTRRMVASDEPVKATKPKRKRRTKAQIAADEANED